MYQVERDRLASFVKEYEWILQHPLVNSQKEASVEQEAIMYMSIINLCAICEQNRKSSAYWNNAEIDNFIQNHTYLYQKMKLFRDSYIAHLDHSGAKEEQMVLTLQSMSTDLEFSKALLDFYLLCKKLVKSA